LCRTVAYGRLSAIPAASSHNLGTSRRRVPPGKGLFDLYRFGEQAGERGSRIRTADLLNPTKLSQPKELKPPSHKGFQPTGT